MRLRFILYIFILVSGMVLSPGIAWAQMDIDTCAPGHQAWDYTAKVVDCVESSIQAAVMTMVNALSTYVQPVLGAMLTIAVAIFGMRMLGGEPDMRAKMPGFALRVGFVAFYSLNMGTLVSSIFAAETNLINIVSGGSSPWGTLDTILGRLIGTGQGVDISMGLLGLVSAALLSTTPAAIMGFIAVSALINLLLFIFRVVFTYLLALTVMGFMLAISPLIIPLALFVSQTERFFNKWLDILISAMMVPVLMFAFLNFFLSGFQAVTDNIFATLCDNPSNPGQSCVTDQTKANFAPFAKVNQEKWAWMVYTDHNFANDLKSATRSQELGAPAVQTNMYAQARRAQNTALLNSPGVDFGPSNVSILQQLIYHFAALWLFASFMKSLIEKIPDLAYNITEASSYISMSPSGIERGAEKMMKTVQTVVTGQR
jgi:type IV secretory pathway VirB6-like protein